MSQRAVLEKKAEDLEKENRLLLLENTVYQKFIDMKQPDQIVDTQKKGRGKRNLPQTLTNEQKYDIANVVNEEIMVEIDHHKKESERMIDALRSCNEDSISSPSCSLMSSS